MEVVALRHKLVDINAIHVLQRAIMSYNLSCSIIKRENTLPMPQFREWKINKQGIINFYSKIVQAEHFDVLL